MPRSNDATTGHHPVGLPTHPARRLSLRLGIRDRTRHRSLMIQILRRARRAGLSGATVFEAHEGFGGSGRIHRDHLLAHDAPVTIVIVDDPARLDEFLDGLADIIGDVLVVVEDVEVVEVAEAAGP